MTYEYVCSACQHAWEAEQRISEAPLTTCPSCHQEAAKRQVSGGAGFILKGSGWYADLYSSAKPKKEEGSGESKKAESSSTESKKDSGTESKKSTDGGSAKPAATTSDSSSSAGTTPTKPAGATAT